MAILSVLAALALVPLAGAVPQPVTAAHRTEWVRADNRPAPGLVVTEDVTGYCIAPARSTPRRYAWRCFADRHFIDPCFSATARSDIVYCPFDPWSTNVRMVELTRRLPLWVDRRGRVDAPWGIWTENAKHCVLAVSGATLTLAGERVRYECAGSGFLVGYADTRARRWTIGYVPRYDLANPHLHARVIGITDVWR